MKQQIKTKFKALIIYGYFNDLNGFRKKNNVFKF